MASIMRATAGFRSPRGPGLACGAAWALGACAVVLLHAVGGVQAQPAPQKTKRIDASEPAGGKSEAPKMAASGSVSNQQLFTDYFTFRIAEFTWAENENKLPELRKKLKAELRKATGEAHTQLNNLCLNQFLEIAKDAEFSAVARINAVLMLGELNEREAALGGGEDAAPLPGAMTQLLALAPLRRPQAGVDDALAAAALSGLMRHARPDLPDATRKELIGVALNLATGGKRPAFRSAEAQAYLQMRSFHLLAALGATGVERNGAEVVQACVAVAQDAEAPLWLRTTAVETLGRLNFQDAPKLNYSLAAKVCGELAVAVLDKKLSRRGLASSLNRIEVGLKGPEGSSGLVAAAQGDHKAYVDELAAKLEALKAVVLDRKVTSDDELYSQLSEPAASLAQWLKEQPVEAALLADLGGR